MYFNYIEDRPYYAKVEAQAKKAFTDFKATVRHYDDVEIVDWQNKNGSKYYSICFVADNRGNLYITGDLGVGILHVDDFHEIKDWANLTTDYFNEKIQCSTEKPRFDAKLFRQDFIRLCYENGYKVDEVLDKEMINQLSAFVGDNPDGILPDCMGEEFENLTDIDDYYEWLMKCGHRYPPRYIYWRVALSMVKEFIDVQVKYYYIEDGQYVWADISSKGRYCWWRCELEELENPETVIEHKPGAKDQIADVVRREGFNPATLPHIEDVDPLLKDLWKNISTTWYSIWFVEPEDIMDKEDISQEEYEQRVDEAIKKYHLEDVITKNEDGNLYICYAELQWRFSGAVE